MLQSLWRDSSVRIFCFILPDPTPYQAQICEAIKKFCINECCFNHQILNFCLFFKCHLFCVLLWSQVTGTKQVFWCVPLNRVVKSNRICTVLFDFFSFCRIQFARRCRMPSESASGRASRCGWWPGTTSTRPGPSPPSAASSSPGRTSSCWRGRTSTKRSGTRTQMRWWPFFLLSRIAIIIF